MRSLAQNSAAAAKEIKGLITTSVEQIQAGAVQVQSAGSTMDDIVTSSHRVTEIMGEVVQASLAQSSKLGDVTEDITAMTADAAQVLRQSTAERELRPVSVVKPVAQGVRARPAANTPMPSSRCWSTSATEGRGRRTAGCAIKCVLPELRGPGRQDRRPGLPPLPRP